MLKGKRTWNGTVVCGACSGYVGMPFAGALTKHFRVIGYDVNEAKNREAINESYNSLGV
jgi:UDP-N-acetyl-D-mannosaminuronate dehydrogenase